MVAVSLTESIRQDRAAVLRHPVLAALVAIIITGLAGANLVQIIPALAPLAASPYFPFYQEAHALVAVMVALYVSYRWHPVFGVEATMLFLMLHVPYFYLSFPANFPEFFHLLLIGLVTLTGIRLIAELRRAVELMQQREREISALGDLNARVLNERIQFMEEVSHREERIVRLQQAICLAGNGGTPLEVARGLLDLLLNECGAEYASFTLVRGDDSLGARVDSFRGIKPFPVASHPGGLIDAVLTNRKKEYIADTSIDPRANPALVSDGIRSYLGLPVRTGERLAGILFVHSTQPHAFEPVMEFLESIGTVLGASMLRAKLCSEPVPAVSLLK